MAKEPPPEPLPPVGRVPRKFNPPLSRTRAEMVLGPLRLLLVTTNCVPAASAARICGAKTQADNITSTRNHWNRLFICLALFIFFAEFCSVFKNGPSVHLSGNSQHCEKICIPAPRKGFEAGKVYR